MNPPQHRQPVTGARNRRSENASGGSQPPAVDDHGARRVPVAGDMRRRVPRRAVGPARCPISVAPNRAEGVFVADRNRLGLRSSRRPSVVTLSNCRRPVRAGLTAERSCVRFRVRRRKRMLHVAAKLRSRWASRRSRRNFGMRERRYGLDSPCRGLSLLTLSRSKRSPTRCSPPRSRMNCLNR